MVFIPVIVKANTIKLYGKMSTAENNIQNLKLEFY